MKYFLQTLFLGALFLCGSIFPHTFAYAQSELTISPAYQDITLNQTDTEVHFSVTLGNQTNDPITLRVLEYDFGSLDESGGVAFLGASNDLGKKYALATWMHPEKDTLTLSPYETQTITVTVKNSEQLSPGGHYGALMFQEGEDSSGTQNTQANDVSVKQMFSTLVFVKKIGGEIYGLNLESEEYTSLLFQLEENLTLHFRNTGNVHLVPRGLAEVRDPLGRVVAKGIINEESSIILPETPRKYLVKLARQLPTIIPGRYTLEIASRYDGKNDFSTTELTFDFIPLPATLGVLTLVATCGWYVARRRRKSGEKKAVSSSDKPSNASV